MSLRHLSRSQDLPEELGNSKPEDIANDQAEGPQQEGGPEHTPDSPEERAPLPPLWLQEGLCLRGPRTTVSFVPGREETWARGPELYSGYSRPTNSGHLLLLLF